MADFATLRTVMVDTQIRPSDVTKFPLIAAMLAVPREAYVPPAKVGVAYMDAPIPLADGRELMEPRSLAKMLDALDVGLADEALIVGGGLGYSAAVLARMAASVVMVEADETMAREAEAALTAQDVTNAVVLHAPLAEGAPKAAPFDLILIDGGVEAVPDALLDQLRDGGRIVALFQDGARGDGRLGIKIDGRVSWRFEFNAAAPVLPGFEIARSFAL